MLFITVTPGTFNNCINCLLAKKFFFVFYVRNLATRKVTTGFRPLFTAKQGIPDMKKVFFKSGKMPFDELENLNQRKSLKGSWINYLWENSFII